MNPHHLRAFLAVHRNRSFTRGAGELSLSQSAVSRQIGQLEEELGVLLFERLGKRLYLTDAGGALVAEAEKLLGATRRAVEAVAGYKTPAQGQLRIAASSTPGLHYLPVILGAFCRRHPDVELTFHVQDSGAVERMVVGNEVDLGFVGAPTANVSLKQARVARDVIVCYASPEHPLANSKRVDARRLSKELFIMRPRGSATRELFMSRLEQLGGGVGRVIELADPGAVKALVRAGVGLSFASRHGLRAELKRGELVELPVTSLRAERWIHRIRHIDKIDRPTMAAFIELAAAHFCEGSAAV